MTMCSYCGDNNEEANLRCSACGAPLKIVEKEAPPPVYYVAQTPPPIVRQGGNRLLWLILGVIIGVPTLFVGGCTLLAIVGSRPSTNSSGQVTPSNGNAIASASEPALGWTVTRPNVNPAILMVILRMPKINDKPGELNPAVNLECYDGKLTAQVGIGTPLPIVDKQIRSHKVTYSFDQNPPVTQNWNRTLVDFVETPDPKQFLKGLLMSKRLRFDFEPGSHSERIIVFDLKGFGDAYQQLIQKCPQ